MSTLYEGPQGEFNLEALRLNDKSGTGETTVSGSWIATGWVPVQENVTDTYLFTHEYDAGKLYTNSGATAEVLIVLPNPVVAGITMGFLRLASFPLRAKPPAGSIIYSGGQMTAGDYLELASDNAVLILTSDGNGNWVATYEDGTLTEGS